MRATEGVMATKNLEPVLVRIPPEVAKAMRELSKRTRVPIAEYQREVFADLLRKYGALPAADTRSAP